MTLHLHLAKSGHWRQLQKSPPLFQGLSAAGILPSASEDSLRSEFHSSEFLADWALTAQKTHCCGRQREQCVSLLTLQLTHLNLQRTLLTL